MLASPGSKPPEAIPAMPSKSPTRLEGIPPAGEPGGEDLAILDQNLRVPIAGNERISTPHRAVAQPEMATIFKILYDTPPRPQTSASYPQIMEGYPPLRPHLWATERGSQPDVSLSMYGNCSHR